MTRDELRRLKTTSISTQSLMSISSQRNLYNRNTHFGTFCPRSKAPSAAINGNSFCPNPSNYGHNKLLLQAICLVTSTLHGAEAPQDLDMIWSMEEKSAITAECDVLSVIVRFRYFACEEGQRGCFHNVNTNVNITTPTGDRFMRLLLELMRVSQSVNQFLLTNCPCNRIYAAGA